MNNSNLTQVLIKKKPEFDVRLLSISNHAGVDMYLNLTHKLGKKKPESELRLLVQKHSSGIEHVLESSTPNRQKKARELRSGFSIQFRG